MRFGPPWPGPSLITSEGRDPQKQGADLGARSSRSPTTRSSSYVGIGPSRPGTRSRGSRCENGVRRKINHPAAGLDKVGTGCGEATTEKSVGHAALQQTMEVSSTETPAGRFHATSGGRAALRPWAQVIVPFWANPSGAQG